MQCGNCAIRVSCSVGNVQYVYHAIPVSHTAHHARCREQHPCRIYMGKNARACTRNHTRTHTPLSPCRSNSPNNYRLKNYRQISESGYYLDRYIEIFLKLQIRLMGTRGLDLIVPASSHAYTYTIQIQTIARTYLCRGTLRHALGEGAHEPRRQSQPREQAAGVRQQASAELRVCSVTQVQMAVQKEGVQL